MKNKQALALAIVAIVAVGQAWSQRKSGDYYEMYSGEVTTLNHLITGTENEHFMFANTIDNLIEYDKYGVLKPSLAESWTSSPDGLVWTFKLRKGVQWYTWQAKPYAEVTAQDWVDAARYILTKANASTIVDPLSTVIKNADEFYEAKITDFSQVGVKAVDKYTLEYTLKAPVPYFLSMLSYVTYLPVNGKFLEAMGSTFGRDHKSVLSNGAYIMTEFEPQVSRVLTKNKKYWDQKNVNIPRLIYRYNKEARTLAPELFLRGQSSYAPIPSSILDTWMKDPAKKVQVRPSRVSYYTYFYGFNFKPTFAAEYEPANWAVAVNNKNFRKAIYSALDRKAAMLTWEPYSPDRRIIKTITPSFFASAGGRDYVSTGDLAALAGSTPFDKAAALGFKAAAMKELAGKATFPVKIMMPYRSDNIYEWANRVQVVEQQLETLLGKDFIDIIPVSFPSTGFLSATRRAGNYGLMELNWGPDYADPQTYTDPFVSGANYVFLDSSPAYKQADGKTSYDKLVDPAMAETKDMKKRYELFAKAEAYLIDEAIVIPFARGGGGFEASKLEPFTPPYAPFGLSTLKFKGQIVMPKGMGTDEYLSLEKSWETARDAALKRAK
ncbi:MAG: peptide ABC transporter substrate-binding protein [Spirochaetae bacterium HGW-Spirochaetae-3]|jgi:oligopeptide transport system substrate-binding protein|nr:MAG: peptide ABC transporter substrate-binding protein [Spirochaetae bacterium HGW-Spirochaetae-3]